MKLAFSNIAWSADQDETMYQKMAEHGFTGLEIAPTRIFPERPYDHLEEAASWREKLHRRYGFEIPSMQSIWFGRTENMFNSAEERARLLDYTKHAIEFAAAIKCRNLVFGCPRNRSMPEGANPDVAVDFFREAAEYAVLHNVIIGIEANPPIYHTNYLNATEQVFQLIEEIQSEGLGINLDLGTMLQNQESITDLMGRIKKVSHVHVSEPMLAQIRKHKEHQELALCLHTEAYKGYVSIEMSRQTDLSLIDVILEYVRQVFGAL